MSITHPLPIRRNALDTENPDELTKIQPERQRSCVQLESGVLRFRLRELAWGEAAIQNERWSCGIRIQQDRLSSYVTFAFVTQGAARWMGAPITQGSLLRIVKPWECVSKGAFEYVAFAVNRSTLQSAALLIRDPDQHEMLPGNQAGRREDAMPLAMRLLGGLYALESPASHPAALAAAEEDLLQLALLLERPRNLTPVDRFSPLNSRLAALRRVEAYLAANGDVIPSVPTLCRITGTSERTLEYAFREHLGVTPVRYLKLRRLMLARRRLQNPGWTGRTVTEIVGSCGVYELGRFSGEYRQLFCELPSETLARSTGSSGLSPRWRVSSPEKQMDELEPGYSRSGDQFDRSKTITPPQSASTMLPRAQPTP